MRRELISRVREDGVSVACASAEFGVSRQTAYKWLKRFAELGEGGLADASRAPHFSPQTTSTQLVERVVGVRRQFPSWGPKKVRAWLMRSAPLVDWPAVSTIGEILDRAGLVERRSPRRRAPPYTAPLQHAMAPNEVWSIDFKGQFRLGDGNLCYPLTVTDNYSRMILGCFALDTTAASQSRRCMVDVFERWGLPAAIRSDNGSPFATAGLWGLSSLSADWLKMGILHERIEVGHPEQNGRHERMHLTLKKETTRPAGKDACEQQGRFDKFLGYFNEIRPHEALNMRTPVEVHEHSARRLADVKEPDYSRFDDVRVVKRDGAVCLGGRRFHVGAALAGHEVGILELEPDMWLVNFAGLDLGLIERGETKLSPADAPGVNPPSKPATQPEKV